MEIEHTFDYYSDTTDVYNEDLVGVFQVEVLVGPAEPYSWGQTRGTERTYEATLLHLKFGDARIDRGLACRMYGRRAIVEAENYISNVMTYKKENYCDY